MSHHTRGAITLLLLLSSPMRLRAQALDPGQREVRVRVEFAPAERPRFWRRSVQSMIGTTLPNAGDTLLLMLRPDAGPIRIPRASIRELYVSQGRRTRWVSAIRGVIAPALIGAALSAAATTIHRKAGDPGPGQAALTSALWGGASGAALGAWSPEERWHRLTIDQRLRKDREYSAGVSP
jgi:hypothetical protein